MIDIILTIPNICQELTGCTEPATSFFYDKYLHHFEEIDGRMVNTPLIQQAELKIRWDQEDNCKLISTQWVRNVITRNREHIINELDKYDVKYRFVIQDVLDKFLNTSFYNKLFKYYGLILSHANTSLFVDSYLESNRGHYSGSVKQSIKPI